MSLPGLGLRAARSPTIIPRARLAGLRPFYLGCPVACGAVLGRRGVGGCELEGEGENAPRPLVLASAAVSSGGGDRRRGRGKGRIPVPSSSWLDAGMCCCAAAYLLAYSDAIRCDFSG